MDTMDGVKIAVKLPGGLARTLRSMAGTTGRNLQGAMPPTAKQLLAKTQRGAFTGMRPNDVLSGPVAPARKLWARRGGTIPSIGRTPVPNPHQPNSLTAWQAVPKPPPLFPKSTAAAVLVGSGLGTAGGGLALHRLANSASVPSPPSPPALSPAATAMAPAPYRTLPGNPIGQAPVVAALERAQAPAPPPAPKPTATPDPSLLTQGAEHLKQNWPAYAGGGLGAYALYKLLSQRKRKAEGEGDSAQWSDQGIWLPKEAGYTGGPFVAGFLACCHDAQLNEAETLEKIAQACLVDELIAEEFEAAFGPRVKRAILDQVAPKALSYRPPPTPGPLKAFGGGLLQGVKNVGNMTSGAVNAAAGAIGTGATGLLSMGATAGNKLGLVSDANKLYAQSLPQTFADATNRGVQQVGQSLGGKQVRSGRAAHGLELPVEQMRASHQDLLARAKPTDRILGMRPSTAAGTTEFANGAGDVLADVAAGGVAAKGLQGLSLAAKIPGVTPALQAAGKVPVVGTIGRGMGTAVNSTSKGLTSPMTRKGIMAGVGGTASLVGGQVVAQAPWVAGEAAINNLGATPADYKPKVPPGVTPPQPVNDRPGGLESDLMDESGGTGMDESPDEGPPTLTGANEAPAPTTDRFGQAFPGDEGVTPAAPVDDGLPQLTGANSAPAAPAAPVPPAAAVPPGAPATPGAPTPQDPAAAVPVGPQIDSVLQSPDLTGPAKKEQVGKIVGDQLKAKTGGDPEKLKAAATGKLTPEQDQEALAMLQGEAPDVPPEGLWGMYQQIPEEQRPLLWLGVGLAAIGMISAMTSEEGGIGSWLMALMGAGLAGGVAANSGLLGEGAQGMAQGAIGGVQGLMGQGIQGLGSMLGLGGANSAPPAAEAAVAPYRTLPGNPIGQASAVAATQPGTTPPPPAVRPASNLSPAQKTQGAPNVNGNLPQAGKPKFDGKALVQNIPQLQGWVDKGTGKGSVPGQLDPTDVQKGLSDFVSKPGGDVAGLQAIAKKLDPGMRRAALEKLRARTKQPDYHYFADDGQRARMGQLQAMLQ